MSPRFFLFAKSSVLRRGTDMWSRLVGTGAVVLLVSLGHACIQPDTALDDFGTNGQSSVTGDNAGPAASDQIGGNSDEAASGDDSEAEPGDNALDTTPAPGASKLPDAGVKVVDAGKPRVDAATMPVADASSAPATPIDAGTTAPGGAVPTKLSFSVTTSSLRGRYAPRNIYAIWVTDAQGKFVKTLAKFAAIRARYLTGWNAAAGGNVVDAVTGATVSNHGARSVTWNLTDASKKPVPDGDYKIVVELTDADKTGATASIPFTKGPAPVKLTPPDQGSFSGMNLVLE